MRARPQMNRPGILFLSWFAAALGASAALWAIAVGQGVGSLLAGCRWIGLTVPMHRQVWALVNQPSLAFGSHGSSIGYWLGGTVACGCLAALTVPLWPRPRSLVAEIVALQVSWMAAVVGLGWMALVDPFDGHLAKWLYFHQVSAAVVWVVPVLGAWISLIPAARLLGLERNGNPQLTRFGRMWSLTVHLAVPALAWLGVASWQLLSVLESAAGDPFLSRLPIEAVGPPLLAGILPIVAVVGMGWFAYPRPWAHRLEPARLTPVLLVVVAAVLVSGLQWAVGAPTDSGGARAVQWSNSDSRNNLRSWVVPAKVLGAGHISGAFQEPGRE